RGTSDFTRAEARSELIRLPTGDGMALVFLRDPLAAARCAVEIASAARLPSGLPLRMGIHSGPVSRVQDINAAQNVAGGGINLGQRVMNCGEAGHILLSRVAAEFLGEVGTWAAYLHDLGECEAKHGTRIHLFNLYGEKWGNPAIPERVRPSRQAGAVT